MLSKNSVANDKGSTPKLAKSEGVCIPLCGNSVDTLFISTKRLGIL